MQFTKGQFQEYRATTKIHIGAEGIDIHQDDTFEFDGQTLKYGGQEYAVPTIRSAIKAGWFVPSTDTDTTYVAKSAAISIRSTNTDEKKQMSVKTVQNEERVVGRAVAETPTQQVQTQDEGTSIASNLKTSTKQKTVLTDRTNVDQEISNLENTQVKSSNFKVIRQEDQQVVTPNVKVTQETTPQAQETDQGMIVGKIKSPTKQTVSLDGASKSFDDAYKPQKAEIFKVAKPTGDVEEQIEGEKLTELLPDAAVAKTTMPSEEKVEETLPVFEWDLKVHWKTRVKNAVALHTTDKETFNKVMAIETKSVQKRINEAIAQ